MEATEFRIGNLVIYNGIVMKISEISSPKPLKDKRYSDKYIFELFDGAGLLNCTIDEISPIPLTEEWFLNFGFEETEDVFRLGTFFLTKSKQGNRYLYQAHKNRFVVMHVHQLQNLYFALYEEELIYKK